MKSFLRGALIGGIAGLIGSIITMILLGYFDFETLNFIEFDF